jgi:hypothetical protein
MAKKKKQNNAKILIPGVVLLAAIIVVLIILLTPNAVIKDCNYYCKQSGFSGAENMNCVVFTQCMAPNYPLTENLNGYCGGDFDVCCCEP